MPDVKGPDGFWLTAREFADFLGIGEDLLKEKVKKGVIPPGVEWNRQSVVWSYRVAVWVSLGAELGQLTLRKGPEETGE